MNGIASIENGRPNSETIEPFVELRQRLNDVKSNRAHSSGKVLHAAAHSVCTWVRTRCRLHLVCTRPKCNRIIQEICSVPSKLTNRFIAAGERGSGRVHSVCRHFSSPNFFGDGKRIKRGRRLVSARTRPLINFDSVIILLFAGTHTKSTAHVPSIRARHTRQNPNHPYFLAHLLQCYRRSVCISMSCRPHTA